MLDYIKIRQKPHNITYNSYQFLSGNLFYGRGLSILPMACYLFAQMEWHWPTPPPPTLTLTKRRAKKSIVYLNDKGIPKDGQEN